MVGLHNIHRYQEIEFSKRILVFVGGQVAFSCRRDHWREDMVEDQDQSSESNTVSDPNDMRGLENIIGAYSGRSLSHHQDIYKALAGFTRYFRTKMKVILCHGIPDKYFDWHLLWRPVYPHTRRPYTPSWSWSGWEGKSSLQIGQWYVNSITDIEAALRKRTWIIWYERKAHNSKECNRICNPDAGRSSYSRRPRNSYGGHVQDRFAPLDCTQTAPTSRTLMDANPPTYTKDVFHPNPGSGFLQFWTVSVTFKVAEATSPLDPLSTFAWKPNPLVTKCTQLDIFGKKGRKVGFIFSDQDWCKDHVPKNHEFILLCEARDRSEDGLGWGYMIMLIKWHTSGKWAERVTVGWIQKHQWKQGLGNGAVWKEIVLG